MTFDFASIFELDAEAAVAALEDASARLLLPVEVDRHFRESVGVLDAVNLLASMRAFLGVHDCGMTDRETG